VGCCVSGPRVIVVRDLQRHLLFWARRLHTLSGVTLTSLTHICSSIFEDLLVNIAPGTKNTITIHSQSAMDKFLPGALITAVCWLLYSELRHLHVIEHPPEESTIVHARPSTSHWEQKRKPPYRKDTFPGSREFETVYGTIQIFEWGPEDGEKVLLIHGLGTPCIALGDMAREFVDKGCRVMLFGECRSWATCWRPLTFCTQICLEEGIRIHQLISTTMLAFTPSRYSLFYRPPHFPGRDLPLFTSWGFL
jgi:hypothetical protein